MYVWDAIGAVSRARWVEGMSVMTENPTFSAKHLVYIFLIGAQVFDCAIYPAAKQMPVPETEDIVVSTQLCTPYSLDRKNFAIRRAHRSVKDELYVAVTLHEYNR